MYIHLYLCIHIYSLAYLKPWGQSKVVDLELLIWLVPLRPYQSFKTPQFMTKTMSRICLGSETASQPAIFPEFPNPFPKWQVATDLLLLLLDLEAEHLGLRLDVRALDFGYAPLLLDALRLLLQGVLSLRFCISCCEVPTFFLFFSSSSFFLNDICSFL